MAEEHPGEPDAALGDLDDIRVRALVSGADADLHPPQRHVADDVGRLPGGELDADWPVLLEEVRLITNVVLDGQPRVRLVLAGARALEERVLPIIAAGRIKPVIDSTFTLADAAAAHTRLETSDHIGKIVLTV